LLTPLARQGVGFFLHELKESLAWEVPPVTPAVLTMESPSAKSRDQLLRALDQWGACYRLEQGGGSRLVVRLLSGPSPKTLACSLEKRTGGKLRLLEEDGPRLHLAAP
ncbi:MAG: hypothetical protein HQL51_17045, partial [Magnetococcales bacterium]|nr:hypothetical protein [Magnetococcales bacterium]